MCMDMGMGNMGTLQLEETTDGASWTTIWTKSGDQGNSWQGATVSIATVNVIQVRWVGTTGSSYESDMAIDDADIISSGCHPTAAPTPVPNTTPSPAPTPYRARAAVPSPCASARP